MESAGTLKGAVKVVVEVLLARFGSAVAAKTVLVLLTVPAMLGLRTTSTTVAEPPLAIVPREQLTALVPEQDPCVGVAETNVVPAGRMSLTTTPVAGLGPAFATEMV